MARQSSRATRWIEFDVGDIEKATAELKSQGYKLLVATQKEPWGQIVTRLLGPEGLLVGITHTPTHSSLRAPTIESGTEMGRQLVIVLYVMAMAAVIVGVDFGFFKDRFWERLTVNIGIVLVFAAFYFRFLR